MYDASWLRNHMQDISSFVSDELTCHKALTTNLICVSNNPEMRNFKNSVEFSLFPYVKKKFLKMLSIVLNILKIFLIKFLTRMFRKLATRFLNGSHLCIVGKAQKTKNAFWNDKSKQLQ